MSEWRDIHIGYPAPEGFVTEFHHQHPMYAMARAWWRTLDWSPDPFRLKKEHDRPDGFVVTVTTDWRIGEARFDQHAYLDWLNRQMGLPPEMVEPQPTQSVLRKLTPVIRVEHE